MSSKIIFVDTNIFLRYLTNDIPAMADKIEKIFQNALNGKVTLVTNEFVIAEIIWVLESFYGYTKDKVEFMVSKILNTKGLEVNCSNLLFKALDIYVSKNVDFIDAYNAVYMNVHNLKQIYTLDKKHFSRIEDVQIEKF